MSRFSRAYAKWRRSCEARIVIDGPFALKDWIFDGFTLTPMTVELAQGLGPALAAMPPWSVLGMTGEMMTAGLTRSSSAARRFAILRDGVPAGVIVIHPALLAGSYLQTLAVLPGNQGKGIGTQLLAWMECEARPHGRWLWLCHSSFNERARRFYERHGFTYVARLPDLLVDGFDEILMRKRLTLPAERLTS